MGLTLLSLISHIFRRMFQEPSLCTGCSLFQCRLHFVGNNAFIFGCVYQPNQLDTALFCDRPINENLLQRNKVNTAYPKESTATCFYLRPTLKVLELLTCIHRNLQKSQHPLITGESCPRLNQVVVLNFRTMLQH